MSNKNLTNNPSLFDAIRVNRQTRAIKRAVLHNVEEGVTDMPAHGIIHLPFKKYSLHKGTLEKLNEILEDYEVRVDAYQLKIRETYVDRIAVTHLDKAIVEPSPAYQSALQTRFFSAHTA